jgi:CBS domain-containing protein
MPLTVGDIMETDVPVVTPEDTVESVLRTLRQHELPGVPVVNSGGRCVGIITEADLVLTGEDADLHLPHYFELFGGLVFLEPLRHFEERLRKATAALAKDLMTPDPVTIEPSVPVAQAARVIARSRHNRLPVVEHGRLVGVVTRLDVLDALTHESDAEDDAVER